MQKGFLKKSMANNDLISYYHCDQSLLEQSREGRGSSRVSSRGSSTPEGVRHSDSPDTSSIDLGQFKGSVIPGMFRAEKSIVPPILPGTLLKFKDFTMDSNQNDGAAQLATLGRLFVCSVVSDLVIFDPSQGSFFDGVLMTFLNASEKSNNKVIAIQEAEGASKSIVLQMFKTKTLVKFPKWMRKPKHAKTFFRKKIAVPKRTEMWRKATKHYITGYLQTMDPEMLALYLSQPRVRKAIDSLV